MDELYSEKKQTYEQNLAEEEQALVQTEADKALQKDVIDYQLHKEKNPYTRQKNEAEEKLWLNFHEVQRREIKISKIPQREIAKNKVTYKRHLLFKKRKITSPVYETAADMVARKKRNSAVLIRKVQTAQVGLEEKEQLFLNSLDKEYKNRKIMKSMAPFYEDMKGELGEAEALKLVKSYGNQSNSPERFAVMDQLTKQFLHINPSKFDLSSDAVICQNASRFEKMARMTAAYTELFSKNGEYAKRMKESSGPNGDVSFYDQIVKQMELLNAMTNYYRIRKLIMADPMYVNMDKPLVLDSKPEDTADVARLKEMMRASYYIALNLNRLTGKVSENVSVLVLGTRSERNGSKTELTDTARNQGIMDRFMIKDAEWKNQKTNGALKRIRKQGHISKVLDEWENSKTNPLYFEKKSVKVNPAKTTTDGETKKSFVMTAKEFSEKMKLFGMETTKGGTKGADEPQGEEEKKPTTVQVPPKVEVEPPKMEEEKKPTGEQVPPKQEVEQPKVQIKQDAFDDDDDEEDEELERKRRNEAELKRLQEIAKKAEKEKKTGTQISEEERKRIEEEKRREKENPNKINIVEEPTFLSDYMTDAELERLLANQQLFIDDVDEKRKSGEIKVKLVQQRRRTDKIDWELEYALSAKYGDKLLSGGTVTYGAQKYSTTYGAYAPDHVGELSYARKGLAGDGPMAKEYKKFVKEAKPTDLTYDWHNTEAEEYAPQPGRFATTLFVKIKRESSVEVQLEKRKTTVVKNTPLMKLYLSSDLQYIQAHWKEVTDAEAKHPGLTAYMQKRIELIKKINAMKEKHPKKAPGQVLNAAKKPISAKDIRSMGDKIYDPKAYYELTGVTFAGHQTTGLGCWSVSMASQMNYRGANLSQQEVRLFRPEHIQADDLLDVEFLGRDIMGSPVEVSEMMNLCFDNMATHVVEAETIYQMNSGMNQQKLNEANIEYFRRSIIDGLVKHKSPVSLLLGSHFVTVVGISGTQIKFLDSASTRKDGVRFGDLRDMCKLEYGQKMQLVWFEQLDEDGKDIMLNVAERTDAVYDGTDLRMEVNTYDDRNVDKGMERAYNSQAVAFNDKKSRIEKQRALMQTSSEKQPREKLLSRGDNYIINDKVYIPRKIVR